MAFKNMFQKVEADKKFIENRKTKTFYLHLPYIISVQQYTVDSKTTGNTIDKHEQIKRQGLCFYIQSVQKDGSEESQRC